jgi:hypothetical protein
MVKERGSTGAFAPLDKAREYSVATKAYLALGKVSPSSKGSFWPLLYRPLSF